MIDIWIVLCAVGFPSATTAFCFWLLKRYLAKRERAAQQRDEARRKNEILTVKGINAAIALGEATAVAIKSNKCNGEMDAALKYARAVKHEHKEFFAEQAINNNY